MVLETSTVSNPSMLGAVPSRTSPPTLPTVFSDSHILYPRINQISGCCPNKVIINLSTALVIPDYSLYYTGPIEAFQPSFYALKDGSLITPPFIDDLAGANLTLLVTGMLTMLFVRNIVVSGDYLRRGKVKKKTLFYILFLSQILAPFSLVPVIMSSFNQSLNCTPVIILSCVSGIASLALLITGILGVKAYKCLDNSRIVFAMLALFQCASATIVVMDVSATRGERRLTGSCVRVSNIFYTRIFVWIQLVESLFICCCFIYASWKSRGSSSARGRISLRLSMEELPLEVAEDINEANPALRGWWDYVSDQRFAPTSQVKVPEQPNQPDIQLQSKLTDFLGRTGSKKRFFSKPTYCPGTNKEKGSKERPSNVPSAAIRGTSPTPSSLNRFGKLVPNVHLFQKVIKDELLYTTFITATCVVVAVLAAIGLNFKNGLTVTGWIALNWCIISLLAIHSFGRVVRRHERDALLQHSFSHNATLHAGIPGKVCEKESHHPRSSPSPSSDLEPETEDNDIHDPFSDTHRLNETRSSWGTFPETSNDLGDPFEEHDQLKAVTVDPLTNFPTSGSNTPLVPHRSLDGSLAQGFSQSWLLERASFVKSEKSTNG